MAGVFQHLPPLTQGAVAAGDGRTPAALTAGGGARQGRVVRIFDVIIIKIATYIYIYYIIYIYIIEYMHNVHIYIYIWL